MRILLSEGASTSAREAVTALGLSGHHIEVCDPDPHCLGRFSRFVRKFHRCPPLGRDPHGYLAFIMERISGGQFDVLLPIHEQGLLFAKAHAMIARHVAIALPSFGSYLRAHSKLGFSQILSELGLSQPIARIVSSVGELIEARRPPMVIKTPVGTASRGTWIVKDETQFDQAIAELNAMDAFREPVIVQEVVEGEHRQSQAVFANGRLIASHAYRQVARGAGGGSSIKESVSHPPIDEDIRRLGEHLAWHGALSVDYVVDLTTGKPCYFDCNPRLVEPMSALLAGLDLVELLLQVSCGTPAVAAAHGKSGVRTHLALQALLGCAAQDESRLSLIRECWNLLCGRGRYAGSREELTPVALDWISFVPPTVATLWLLATPAAAHYLPQKGWGPQLLTPHSIRMIEAMDVGG
jgi:predicted ATP-grasp superfamily ATP-dependent carboligase